MRRQLASEHYCQVLETAAPWGESKKRNKSHNSQICACNCHGVPEDCPNVQSDLEWKLFPTPGLGAQMHRHSSLAEGRGLDWVGNRRELVEKEQTILYCSSGREKCSGHQDNHFWAPKQEEIH